ncbi:HlyD family secretion protein [Bosea sp. AS-1]|uniref:HlyD family secretion protein n=1 Tax=Bosea sp. AS-1 TaxID=2015316 RepID=UPI000B777C06|nr:HlyD family secretion protein [Bosea sp. AS-1]
MSAAIARLAPAEGQPKITTNPAPAQRRKPRRALINLARASVLVGGVGLAIVIPLGWGHWVAGMTDQTTDNAYVRADTTPISTQVNGRIKRLAVADFQTVKAGDPLFEIDDAEYVARVSQAEAGVAAAEAALRNLESRIELQRLTITQAESGIAAILADRDRASQERGRQEALTRDGWTTAQRLELAVADTKRFDARLREKEAEVAVQRQQLEVLSTQEQQARAEQEGRRAALDLARIELGNTRIVAPVAGAVSASAAREGQYVRTGTQLISVVPLQQVHVIANYKETQLSRVRPGQLVSLKIDTFPGLELKGRVERLSPASGAEFSLLPADNATGNFTKVAQRIAVRIALDPAPELQGLLRPGMSVVTTIHTDRQATDAAAH